MYSTLFINFAKCSDRQIIFTQIGDHSDYSSSYRDRVWKKWVGMDKDESKGFFIDCKDYDECRHLQRTFHEVFKPWITESCIISLPRPLAEKLILTILERIRASFDSPDRHAIREDLMMRLVACEPVFARSGYIYLLRINGKFKIGLTNDIARRKADLEQKYGTAIKIVDLKKTDKMELDEAILQMKCSAYKSVDNNLGEQKVDESYCSELYRQDPAVLQIWRDYWKKNMKLEII